ncbi:MAG: 50S ribosomal protein L29 [Holosporales bacterium]|jgi:ribosomal protein L29|nr:50S ribosomal protein L29 [Holosporales bacterium]
MKFVDLLKKDSDELCRMCVDFKREYMNLRMLQKTTQDLKTHTIKQCKRNIARVKTRLTQLKDRT